MEARAPAQVRVGETFRATVLVRGARGLKGGDLVLRFDPSRLEAISVTGGGALGTVVGYNMFDNAAGTARFAAAIAGEATFAGDGVCFEVTFRARASGTAVLTPAAGGRAALMTADLVPIPVTWVPTTVHISD